MNKRLEGIARTRSPVLTLKSNCPPVVDAKRNHQWEEKWSTWLLRVLWVEEVMLVWVTLSGSLKQLQSRTGSEPTVVGVRGPRGRVFLSTWWSWEQQRGWWEAVHRDGSARCAQQIIYNAGSGALKPVKRSTCGRLDFWVVLSLVPGTAPAAQQPAVFPSFLTVSRS